MLKKISVVLLMMFFCFPASYAQKALFNSFMKKISSAKEALFKKSTSAAKPAEQAAAQAVAAQEGASAAAERASAQAAEARERAAAFLAEERERAAAEARKKAEAERESAKAEPAAMPGEASHVEKRIFYRPPLWDVGRQYRALRNLHDFIPRRDYENTFFLFEKTPSNEWLVNGKNVVFASRTEVAKYMAAVEQGTTNIPMKEGVVLLKIKPAFELQNVSYRVYTKVQDLKNHKSVSNISHKEYAEWQNKNVQEMIEKGEGIDWEGINALPY